MTRRRRTALILVCLVGVPLVVLASGAAWLWWQIDPPGAPGARVEVHIERGWGIARIGTELSRRGVVDSATAFSIYARLQGDTSFQAGTYELRKNMGGRAAVRALQHGPRIDYTELTIRPGLWLREIADRVGKLPGRDAHAFLEATRNNAVRSALFEPQDVNNLEGLLWPDTYKIDDSEDEIAVLKTMVTTFDHRAAEIGLPNADVQGNGPYQIIIIASLVEAEAKVDADRPLIASVIYNRLARGMPLQVDATLIYARGDPKQRTLTDADKAIDSPYNTYAHTGLPPTPIAGVSEKSLRAALAPAPTDYLYYVVTDKSGRHSFASTLPEHERNIEIARANGVL